MSDLGNKKIMANNIKYYMQKNNVSQADVCKTLGIKTTTFADWVHARTYPRIDKIELLSNYFGISKADLVEQRPVVSLNNKSTLSDELSKVIDQLDDDTRRKLLELAHLYLNDLHNT